MFTQTLLMGKVVALRRSENRFALMILDFFSTVTTPLKLLFLLVLDLLKDFHLRLLQTIRYFFLFSLLYGLRLHVLRILTLVRFIKLHGLFIFNAGRLLIKEAYRTA